jgi:hypothetical protein
MAWHVEAISVLVSGEVLQEMIDCTAQLYNNGGVEDRKVMPNY